MNLFACNCPPKSKENIFARAFRNVLRKETEFTNRHLSLPAQIALGSIIGAVMIALAILYELKKHALL